MKPKAWVDKNNVVVFRADVKPEEVKELDAMLTQAFNAGLISGYAQGRAA